MKKYLLVVLVVVIILGLMWVVQVGKAKRYPPAGVAVIRDDIIRMFIVAIWAEKHQWVSSADIVIYDKLYSHDKTKTVDGKSVYWCDVKVNILGEDWIFGFYWDERMGRWLDGNKGRFIRVNERRRR